MVFFLSRVNRFTEASAQTGVMPEAGCNMREGPVVSLEKIDPYRFNGNRNAKCARGISEPLRNEPRLKTPVFRRDESHSLVPEVKNISARLELLGAKAVFPAARRSRQAERAL